MTVLVLSISLIRRDIAVFIQSPFLRALCGTIIFNRFSPAKKTDGQLLQVLQFVSVSHGRIQSKCRDPWVMIHHRKKSARSCIRPLQALAQ